MSNLYRKCFCCAACMRRMYMKSGRAYRILSFCKQKAAYEIEPASSRRLPTIYFMTTKSEAKCVVGCWVRIIKYILCYMSLMSPVAFTYSRSWSYDFIIFNGNQMLSSLTFSWITLHAQRLTSAMDFSLHVQCCTSCRLLNARAIRTSRWLFVSHWTNISKCCSLLATRIPNM